MRKGFTLIEMAIVLVIIGVLIGGVLVAKSLMQTARIQSLIKDFGQYEIAAVKFKEAFQYYPGDSPDFLPAGNGDNILSWGAQGDGKTCGDKFNPERSNYEYYQFFAHLSQAEMLDASYVPYMPIMCGGPHDDTYEIGTAGVYAPYVDLGDKQGPVSGAAHKYNIFPIRNDIFPALRDDNPVKLTLYAQPAYVIPLETKLGSAIYNFYGGGQCVTSLGPTVNCTDSTAEYGQLYWIFRR